MDELTYEKDGKDIKTSKFLKNRKSCCKTLCLHCPYGFTLKKEGLNFEVITADNYAEAKALAPKNDPEQSSLSTNMLASAFGGTKTKQSLSRANQKDYLLVKIKNETCALIKVKNNLLTELYHKKYFEDQGITKDLVTSFLGETKPNK